MSGREHAEQIQLISGANRPIRGAELANDFAWHGRRTMTNASAWRTVKEERTHNEVPVEQLRGTFMFILLTISPDQTIHARIDIWERDNVPALLRWRKDARYLAGCEITGL